MIQMLYFDVDPDECRELPEILKPDEVAEFLCIHKNTVYKMIKRGELPALRVGRSWRVLRSGLTALAYNGWQKAPLESDKRFQGGFPFS